MTSTCRWSTRYRAWQIVIWNFKNIHASELLYNCLIHKWKDQAPLSREWLIRIGRCRPCCPLCYWYDEVCSSPRMTNALIVQNFVNSHRKTCFVDAAIWTKWLRHLTAWRSHKHIIFRVDFTNQVIALKVHILRDLKIQSNIICSALLSPLLRWIPLTRNGSTNSRWNNMIYSCLIDKLDRSKAHSLSDWQTFRLSS